MIAFSAVTAIVAALLSMGMNECTSRSVESECHTCEAKVDSREDLDMCVYLRQHYSQRWLCFRLGLSANQRGYAGMETKEQILNIHTRLQVIAMA